jgi:hypothetical protein
MLDTFREIWLCDFEFHAPSGERPEPLCLVAREFRTGRTLRLWVDELRRLIVPPFAVDASALFVAFYASAELGCFLALDWPMPVRILDLFAEFRNLTNGIEPPCGNSLLGALTYCGIDGIDAADKELMRQLAMRGGPYSEAERVALLDYCESDVLALDKLLRAMQSRIDWPRSLLRGRFMAAAARIEWTGVPVDAELLSELRRHWKRVQGRLIHAVNADYGVFVPTDQPTIDPASRYGGAILDTATAWNLDPFRLADAAGSVWRESRTSTAELCDAIREARQATGLTCRCLNQWEDAGHDSASWPGLDTAARELAGRLPALGIGEGFRQDTGHDDTDYGGRLWALLRQPDPTSPAKHDPRLLDQAAELVARENGDNLDESVPMTFSSARWTAWLTQRGIPWPRLPSGALALDDDTFRTMSKRYPEVAPIHELRNTLGQLRLNDLAVGSDGRNRTLLSAFRSRTGRNQPSNSRFIFGPSCWIRSLIRPEPGRALAYVDWEQQEFGIAAALSGDVAMQAAYSSGDPYLTFAKQAGAVPADATKHSHPSERAQFKVCALGVQYGMGEESLAASLGEPPVAARQLLRLHRQTYPKFWAWSDGAVNHATLLGFLDTVFGWRVHVGADANPRSLANFPCQANGAEMLRLACCLMTEAGWSVCAPVHDAVLIEADADGINEAVANAQSAMRQASEIVLSGFPLRTDAKVVRHPDRYADDRGARVWELVTGIVADIRESEAALALVDF